MKVLALFFAFGAVMAGATALALATPGGQLEVIWTLKPAARRALTEFGPISAIGMALLSATCLIAAVGLWLKRAWGIAIAAVILTFNLLGDTWNATAGHDPRGYIGIPVAVALLVYLARQGAKLSASRNPQEDR